MSGSGNIQGTEYQHRVAAYVAAHIVAERRLSWLSDDDTPTAISLETEGPGDDLAIEFGHARRTEVQIKHGLERRGLIAFLRQLDPEKNEQVLLVTDPSASEWIRLQLPRDLKRLHSGWTELSPDARGVELELGQSAPVLHRVQVHVLDTIDDSAAHSQSAMAHLAAVLLDPKAAETAHGVLVRDAAQRGRNRWRADRRELLKVLSAHRIYVRPPTIDERLNTQLDLVLDLHKRRQHNAARSALDAIRKRETGEIPASIQYRLHHLDGALRLANDDLAGAFDFAMRARALDPTRPDSYRVAAKAKALAGEFQLALEVAAEGRSRAPNDPKLWSMFLQLSEENDKPSPRPPLAIEQSFDFRRASALLAFERHEWSVVVRLTEDLLREAREVELVYARAESLHRLRANDRLTELEVVRLATETLDESPDGDMFALRALQLRARAQRALGQESRAMEDEERVRLLDSADPLVLRERAVELVRAGRGREAVEVLKTAAIDRSAVVLAFRCSLFFSHGLADQARSDLSQLLAKLHEFRHNEEACNAIADAAYELADADAMERAFGTLVGPRRLRTADLLTRGRIALLRKNIELAEQLFREVQAEDPSLSAQAELASELAERGDFKSAARVSSGLPLATVPIPYLARIARALLDEGEWTRVQSLLEHLRGLPSPMPDWAVRMAAHVAVLRDDSEAAVKMLEEVVRRGGRIEPAVRLNLASALLDLGNESAAREQIDLASAEPVLAADEFIHAVRLLVLLREDQRAVDLAFRGFRTWKNEPELHRLLATLVLRTKLAVPEQVLTDTSILIEGGSKARWLTIVDSDADSQRSEIDARSAERQGLLGLRVGDSLPRRESVLGREERIARIVPRVALEARRVLDNFEHAFAEEDFFATSVNVGDLSKPSDFQPFIATLEARKQHVMSLFEEYKKSNFPLSFVAENLGCSVPELMDAMAADSTLPRVMTESLDAEGFAASTDAADQAKAIVLTRSALHTAAQLELLPHLADLPIVATRSLVRELRAEVFEAERTLREGSSVMHQPEHGLRMINVPPGSEPLRTRLETVQRQLEWVQRLRIVPRAFQQRETSCGPSLPMMIGLAANDAVELARDGEMTVYADDFGLRALLIGRGSGRSFSTIALVAHLRKRGAIDETRSIHLLLRIFELRQGPIQPDAALIIAGIQRFQATAAKFEDFLEFSFSARMTLLEATKLAAELIKRDANSLQRIGARRLTRSALQIIAKMWPNRTFCARLLVKEVGDSCLLLPQCRDECESAAREFLAGGRS